MRALILPGLLTLAILGPACGDKDEPPESTPVDGGDDGGDDGGEDDTGTPEREYVTVLHTNDWQSHMLGWGPNAEYTPDSTDDDVTVGGLARAKTLIDEIRGSTVHPVILLDGGDWMGGALFQELRATHAVELQVMTALGYDAAVVGNHEFDWGPDGLGELISKGDELGADVPLLLANLAADPDSTEDDGFSVHLESGRVTPTIMLELDNGLSVGVVGLMGYDAYRVAPDAYSLLHSLPEEAAGAHVEALQSEGADLVIALTHSGVRDDIENSPDHVLAAAVPGIDLIVGGHSHTRLPDPLTTDDGTFIVQAGAYTRYVGELVMSREVGGAWEIDSYALHELDDSILGDSEITDMVDGFLAELDAGPLAELGTSFSEPIASIPGDMEVTACAESGLGDLVTDAFRWKLSELDPDNPIDVAFESQGVIRDDLTVGTGGVQGFSDIFRVLPLGYATDDRPGYALVDFYVNAADLEAACEVTASIPAIEGCSYFIEQSGMRCTYDDERGTFSKVLSVEIWDDEVGDYVELDTSGADETLYHVTVDTYVASLMYIIGDLTSGFITLEPKDADGNVVDPTTRIFDADPDTDGVQEVKLWEALRDYTQSFEDTDGDGVPDVPESYTSADGRIIEL